MAAPDPNLEKALSLFKAGSSVRECEKLTGVNYKKVDREAKKRGIVKGELSQLIEDKTRVDSKFVTLPVTDKSLVSQIVSERVSLLTLVDDFNQAAVLKARRMLHTAESGLDLRNIVEAVDKVTITAKINERHAKPSVINNTQNTQNNLSGLSDDDLIREIDALKVIHG